jgi:hypothetical protein
MEEVFKAMLEGKEIDTINIDVIRLRTILEQSNIDDTTKISILWKYQRVLPPDIYKSYPLAYTVSRVSKKGILKEILDTTKVIGELSNKEYLQLMKGGNNDMDQ